MKGSWKTASRIGSYPSFSRPPKDKSINLQIDDLSNIEEAYKATTPEDLQDLALQLITSGACEFTVTQ
ncbi:MAG: hypothetical protein ACJAQT_005015 [Akkermansiaceae bacterium]|jgi:hypothetical protein